jgi:predicted NBD/HSP70 family sugar kinase
LIRLARFFDSELYAGLSDHLVSDPDLQGGSLIEVAAALRSDERTPASDLLINLARGDHKRILRFFDSLENTYVQFLAMGLANVVNLLDVDNAFLSGPLIEMFDRLPQFRDNVQQSIKKYLLREDKVNLRIRADAGSHMWIGAGLLFRDSAYAEAAGHSGDLLGGRHST